MWDIKKVYGRIKNIQNKQKQKPQELAFSRKLATEGGWGIEHGGGNIDGGRKQSGRRGTEVSCMKLISNNALNHSENTHTYVYIYKLASPRSRLLSGRAWGWEHSQREVDTVQEIGVESFYA